MGLSTSQNLQTFFTLVRGDSHRIYVEDCLLSDGEARSKCQKVIRILVDAQLATVLLLGRRNSKRDLCGYASRLVISSIC